MTVYTLQRLLDSGIETTGKWLDDLGAILCYTIERPWLNNANEVSCIPAGRYRCTRFTSPTKGDVWLVNDVIGRSMIEIHAANFARQLLGCIAVGDQIGKIGNEVAVLNSQKTFAMLHSKLPDEFYLNIIGV